MAAAEKWYYQADLGAVGPISRAELKRLIELDVIRPTTLLRKGEHGPWVPSERMTVELERAGAVAAIPLESEVADWYCSLQGKRKLGPVTRSMLGSLLQQGKLQPADLVCARG